MADYLTKTAEVEARLKKVGEDAVFKLKSSSQLADYLGAITSTPEFKNLPAFRQIAITNYLEGIQAGIARLCGEEVKEKLAVKTKLKEPAKKIDVPRMLNKLQPGAKWHRHKNGLGWVASTAYVEATAFVGPKAIVYGTARVLERAQVYGMARVFGDAECSGACHVHGLAQISDTAHVFDAAKVLGRAIVRGGSRVGGTAVIRGKIEIVDQEIYDERIAVPHEEDED